MSNQFKQGQHAVIIIPTYNAKYNITKVINKILLVAPNARIIVVDDNSPDKTGELIKNIYGKNKRIKLIIRNAKGGRGSAVIAGLKEGLKEKDNYFFIEMDGDFSHDPAYIPELIKVCQIKDVIIASKYLKRSQILGLSLKRKIFSRLVNIFLRIILGVPISDYTDGFRCYSRKVIETINLNEIQAKGFIVLSEMIYLIHKQKFTFGEIPIKLIYYKNAGSNFNSQEIKEAFFTILKLKLNFI